MLNFVQKWRELAPLYFYATAPFFTFGPPRRAPPFLVHASGAVALKLAHVPSTVIGSAKDLQRWYLFGKFD